jgi:branched-chain amino acid aminotransferase
LAIEQTAGVSTLKQDYSAGAAWMEGEIIPVSQARISVLDWGLTHNDITYDVVHAWEGKFFRLNAYLDRFHESLEKLSLSIPQDRDTIHKILHAIVGRSGLRNSYVSMVASRGRPSIPGSRDPRDCENHFYAWCVPFIWVFQPDVVKRGARLYLPRDVLRIPPKSVDPLAKNYHWGDFTRALIAAKESGFDNTVLSDADGHVTEGPGFNLFMVKDGKIRTPETGVLGGITRRTTMEIAESLSISCEESAITVADFMEADEVFATTTGGGIVPIATINERIFSNGAAGAITRQLSEAYWKWHEDPSLTEVIDYES